jgi:hypothetical protein
MLEDLLGKAWTYNESLRRGNVAAWREDLLDVVQVRFPDLLAEAHERVYSVEDPQVLRSMMLKIVSAQSNEDARKLLLELH